MQVETLKDVLQWTQDYHQCLADCLQHCVDKNESERAKLLLSYLSDHEEKLVDALARFEKETEPRVLNTWCYEFLDKHPIKCDVTCEEGFSQMTPAEIISETTRLHQEVIELYRYLQERSDLPSSTETLTQLVELEKHEAMRMVHGANRLEDV